MEKVRMYISNWLDRQDSSWRALSLEKQRRYTRFLFLAYLLLTAVIIFQLWCDAARSDSGLAIEHIDSPVPKRESPALPPDTKPNY